MKYYYYYLFRYNHSIPSAGNNENAEGSVLSTINNKLSTYLPGTLNMSSFPGSL